MLQNVVEAIYTCKHNELARIPTGERQFVDVGAFNYALHHALEIQYSTNGLASELFGHMHRCMENIGLFGQHVPVPYRKGMRHPINASIDRVVKANPVDPRYRYLTPDIPQSYTHFWKHVAQVATVTVDEMEPKLQMEWDEQNKLANANYVLGGVVGLLSWVQAFQGSLIVAYTLIGAAAKVLYDGSTMKDEVAEEKKKFNGHFDEEFLRSLVRKHFIRKI